MSLTFATTENRMEQISIENNNALIGDNNDIIITNDLYTDSQTDNKSYNDENSCIDNNDDNSLNVTGEQKFSHIHISNSRDMYNNNDSEQCQQKQRLKALNLNGNEMRHRKNLLFNLINTIMNYLGNTNKNYENNRNEGNLMTNDDHRTEENGNIQDEYTDDSDKLIIMNEYDRLSTSSNDSNKSCDNRNIKVEKINSDLNETDSMIEYAFSDETDVGSLKIDQPEGTLVPQSDSFSVTLK